MVNLKMQIPSNFYEGETRCNYYVSPKTKELWAVLLDLLVEFMRVCNENGIQYFMCGGTILGAVRHNGFIPWDDDIDIMMLRSEYEKLCKIGPIAFKHPYFFQTEQTDPGSCKGHAQIRNSNTTGFLIDEKQANFTFNQGIFIDVFPLDDIPSRFRVQYRHIENVVRLHHECKEMRDVVMYHRCPSLTKNFRKDIMLVVKNLWHRYRWSKQSYTQKINTFEDVCTKYNNTDCTNVILTPFPIENGIWKKSYFSDAVYFPFEMINVPVPIGYESILKEIYGDWHKFIINDSLHGNLFIDTNVSYKHYLK